MIRFLVFFLLVNMAFSEETMTKIVFRGIEPPPAAGSFAAQPKTLYRMGSSCGRSEEAFDSEMNIQGLMIANGKDVWIINLATKTGRHMIDTSSTTHDFHATLVPPVRNGNRLIHPASEFELGREMEFMKSRNATPHDIVENGEKEKLYETVEDGYTLRVYVSPKTDLLIGSAVAKNGQVIMRLAYDDYRTGLKADPSLFRPPEDVTITESK